MNSLSARDVTEQPHYLQDTEVYYDLKKLLEESGAPVPSQLAHHEAARTKPGTVVRETTVYAKK